MCSIKNQCLTFIPYFYCFFLFVALPLRWIYYKAKKWHYFLLVSKLESFALASRN